MSSKINIVIDEDKLKQLICEYLECAVGELSFDKKNVCIETKSKQNYKSEWETAAFRAKYDSFL